MFKPGTTATQRRVVIECLQGESLYALIKECARFGDLEALQDLEDAGHFEVHPNLMLEPNVSWIESNCLIHRCLPNFDALGAVLYSAQLCEQTHPARVRGEVVQFTSGLLKLDVSLDLSDFVKRQYKRAFSTLDFLRERELFVGHEDFQMNTHCLEVAAGVLAGALGDVELWQMVANRNPLALDDLVTGHAALKHSRGRSITARGVAVLYSSMPILDGFTAAQVAAPMGRVDDYGGYADAHAQDFVRCIGQHELSPNPDVFVWRLSKTLSALTSAVDLPPSFADLAQESFDIRNMLTAWPHIGQRAWSEIPLLFSLNKTESLSSAMEGGNDEVFDEMLSQWLTLEKTPPKAKGGGAFRVVAEEHILNAVLCSGMSPDAKDALVVRLFEGLELRGNLEFLLDPNMRFNYKIRLSMDEMESQLRPMAHTLILFELPNSLSYLCSRGLSVNCRDEFNRTALEFASRHRANDDIIALLQSTQARRNAVQAIGYLEDLSSDFKPSMAA